MEERALNLSESHLHTLNYKHFKSQEALFIMHMTDSLKPEARF